MRLSSLLLVLAACATTQDQAGDTDTDPGAASALRHEVFPGAVTDAVDLLWVVDGSASMAEELAALDAGLTAYLTPLRGSVADWHLGVVSANSASTAAGGALLSAGRDRYVDPTTPDAEAVIPAMIASDPGDGKAGQGLRAAWLAVSTPTPELVSDNAGFLRRGAALHVVLVSDAEDESAPDLTRAEFLAGLDGMRDTTAVPLDVSAIVATASGCPGAAPGAIYEAVARSTGGQVHPVCAPDWAAALTSLGQLALAGRDGVTLAERARPATVDLTVTMGARTWTAVLTSDGVCEPASCVRVVVDGADLRFADGWRAPLGSTVTVDYEADEAAE